MVVEEKFLKERSMTGIGLSNGNIGILNAS